MNASKAAYASIKSKKDRVIKDVSPSTSNIPYSSDQVEWLKAVEKYKVDSCKRFLSSTDYLKVAQELGYVKLGLFA